MNDQLKLNDPDFDMPTGRAVSPPSENPLSSLSPKTIFLGGIVVAVLILCTIGFFILLGIMIKGGASAVAAAPQRPAVPASPGGNEAFTGTVPPISASDHIRGNPKAKVTIVEFSDTECPFCKRFHPTMQQVLTAYGDKVRWVYKHFPLDSLHAKARKEAEATECAGELGGNDGFWKYLDKLFAVTPSNDGLDPAQLPQIAEDVGLNRKKFETCLNSGKYAGRVAEQLAQGEAAGARGTPHSLILVGDKTIPVSGAVPFAQLKSILDPLVQ